MRARGVLALQPRAAALPAVPEQRQQLETFAGMIAMALERVHYVEVAQQRDGADGVRAPAQLAAGRPVARPAHAADGAGRPAEIAGMQPAPALARQPDLASQAIEREARSAWPTW